MEYLHGEQEKDINQNQKKGFSQEKMNSVRVKNVVFQGVKLYVGINGEVSWTVSGLLFDWWLKHCQWYLINSLHICSYKYLTFFQNMVHGWYKFNEFLQFLQLNKSDKKRKRDVERVLLVDFVGTQKVKVTTQKEDKDSIATKVWV